MQAVRRTRGPGKNNAAPVRRLRATRPKDGRNTSTAEAFFRYAERTIGKIPRKLRTLPLRKYVPAVKKLAAETHPEFAGTIPEYMVGQTDWGVEGALHMAGGDALRAFMDRLVPIKRQMEAEKRGQALSSTIVVHDGDEAELAPVLVPKPVSAVEKALALALVPEEEGSGKAKRPCRKPSPAKQAALGGMPGPLSLVHFRGETGEDSDDSPAAPAATVATVATVVSLVSSSYGETDDESDAPPDVLTFNVFKLDAVPILDRLVIPDEPINHPLLSLQHNLRLLQVHLLSLSRV